MNSLKRIGISLLLFCVCCPIVSADEGDRSKKPEFVPLNDREVALFEMIKELRSELAALRREVEESRGDIGELERDSDREVHRDRMPSRDPGVKRDGDRDRTTDRDGARDSDLGRDGERIRDGDRARDGDRPRYSAESHERNSLRDKPANRNTRLQQQAKRIFAAYDKNRDGFADFEEWLKLRDGEMTDERRKREEGHFLIPAGDDKRISFEEFYRWMESRQRGVVQRDAGKKPAQRDRE